MFALLTIIVLLLIAVAAPLWGVDSRDAVESAEYERRRTWRGRPKDSQRSHRDRRGAHHLQPSNH